MRRPQQHHTIFSRSMMKNMHATRQLVHVVAVNCVNSIPRIMFCHFERRKNGKSTRGIELEKWSVPPFFGPRSGIGHARKFFPVFDAHCAYRHVLQIGTSVRRSHMRSGDNFTQFVRHITIPFISFSALSGLFSPLISHLAFN